MPRLTCHVPYVPTRPGCCPCIACRPQSSISHHTRPGISHRLRAAQIFLKFGNARGSSRAANGRRNAPWTNTDVELLITTGRDVNTEVRAHYRTGALFTAVGEDLTLDSATSAIYRGERVPANNNPPYLSTSIGGITGTRIGIPKNEKENWAIARWQPFARMGLSREKALLSPPPRPAPGFIGTDGNQSEADLGKISHCLALHQGGNSLQTQ
ncbi:hypothetical protein ACRALDRAFT_213730 [Sodiomyces alcalophilus JCM 7366]|uniref:uncharacterized protein n=1 Tax=Sodiomyces alcalophilus JCM 7366 TaxID=591952 RepID=UPI0039B5ED71